MRVYNVTVTEKQLRVLRDATELLTRIGLGQWREIIDWMPLEKGISSEDLNEIGQILSKYTEKSVDGYSSYIGIHNARDFAKISDDLYQVFRHRLSWDHAKDNNLTNEDGSRNWADMLSVYYDDPMKYSYEPFAIVKELHNEKE